MNEHCLLNLELFHRSQGWLKREVHNQQENQGMEFSLAQRLSPLLLKGSRILLQLVLASIFLFFFGVPAIKQYLAKEVMVVKTLRENFAAPSISINARNPKTRRGWKKEEYEKYLQ